MAGIRRPSVAVSSPTNGSEFFAPATVLIEAAASSLDGTISRVEFYQGTTAGLIAESVSIFWWKTPTPGIESSWLASPSLARLVRCAVMAKRCASSRTRWI
ncbi:MAG: hypothetical protein HGB05_20365 [Chloroflexi bacterium]|nr:hypothetical protein [Chloroflexota bacterium]